MAAAAYNDVVLIGKTGMGKSTAGNVLLGLSPDGAAISSDEIERFKHSEGLLCTDHNCFITSSNAESCTKSMSTFANVRTRIRVTDVPGFGDSERRENATAFQTNLQFVRDIARLQKVIAFRCVLYFLPFRELPERLEGYFREELEVLYFYFGESVFQHMIMIATNPRRAQAEEFGPREEMCFRNFVELALKKATGDKYSICPPILYVPLVGNHNMLQEAVLRFNPTSSAGGLKVRVEVCIKCSCEINEHTVIDRRDGTRVNIADSMCHPAMIPKYTKAIQILGTILHIITIGIPHAIAKLKGTHLWPGYGNNEEKCINCSGAPGTKGCHKVNTEGRTPDGILFAEVNHSNKTENLQFREEEV